MSGRARLAGASAAALASAFLLSGCSAAVVTSPAPKAADPACANAMLKTPDTVAGGSRRTTTSQGTTAYGDPARVVVSCGAETPAPTTDKCLSVDGIDWVVKEARNTGTPSHTWTATTYGREPAMQVVMDADKVPSSDVLPGLSTAAGELPQKRRCL
ncbi:DUF3515 family protein [Arthrobacter sp. UM1]|uniref:DUF3515 family protein n=1 Tax=Arthrobacter sp. UM1 TaxID=2766776 RepID=UPI001CF6DCD0|nr:DUF3515 family protein [Arthrobacter sp. UM1]MCB4207303.1 DUF3515 family protein [Arthrobacter sp. UM1]